MMNKPAVAVFISAFAFQFYRKFPGVRGRRASHKKSGTVRAPLLSGSFRVQIVSTFFAFGPLSVVSTSNWTRCPS